MRVAILSNGNLEVKEIKNTLEELQGIVGGYIEFPFISKVFRKNIIDTIINEEGKFIDGLKPEIALIDREKQMVLDVIYGNCIFASHDEEGNTIGLTDKQIEVVMEELELEVELTNQKTGKDFTAKALFM